MAERFILFSQLVLLVGDMEGLNTVLAIALGIFVLSLFCWIFAIYSTVRYSRSKKYSESGLSFALFFLLLFAITSLFLFKGTLEIQLITGVFYFIPIGLFLYFYLSKPKTS